MKKIFIIFLVFIFLAATKIAFAEDRDILREGFLGAGAGAIGGLASGAKGRNVWKGALAGAGVNVVGGALLDSMSGEHVENVKTVQSMPAQDAYASGYKEGFSNGYKQGYTEGYKDGVKDTKGNW
jgi:hypothetical protein